ncbi:hypothetical protein CFC21_085282 [Triticum aestivum]|uniref:Uncharacterized protein n=3 Tax=Triticum TaxID=4564 RepID=A0A8R7QWI4_TRIUA|nr:transcriptional activator protein Pur-alpha-like [Triticum dicoccoides]XP_044406961.1 transcriptional activator protein Pur-alpha-like [Triticum aestivum]KAF7081328.1 hypothetical protein CFC21_085282 [Triticum aestivum]
MAAASSLRNALFPLLRKRIAMARRMSTTGTGTGAGITGGGSGTGGAANSGGARTTGSGGASNSGGRMAGGGSAGNSGGSGGATGLEELRRDALKETGRLLDVYNKLSDVDTKLLEELARLERENLKNSVRAKENRSSITYGLLGSGAAVFLTISSWLGQYIQGCVVHDAAKEVVEMQRLRKLDALIDGLGEEGAADKTAAASANVDTK